MARFNPQAFIAGMQSLLTPQQQAQQQVQQMRMQQMNQARENEALINARQLQGEQLGIQRKEAERAGVRFDLEKEANERAKAAEERAKKIQNLQLSGARTDAAKGFLDPVAKAKSAYTAAQTAYNTAKSRPAAYSRADYLKITNDLTKAQTEYEQELAKQKTLLKYVDPSYGFDETIFGAPIEFTAPLSQADAIKALKDAQAGSKGTKSAPPPPPPGEEPTKVGMQTSPVVPATQVAAAEPAGIDPLSLLAPASLGVGVTAPAGIGAVKPPAKKPLLGKDGKPIPPPYKPPVLPPRGVRQRVYPESPDMFLTTDEQEAAGKMLTAYEDYVTRTFNVDPLDANFNEKYYRYISDPNVFKRFTDRYARQLAISSPESAASILASTESMLLGSIGDKADVPTALRAALTDAATKTAALVEAKDEAAYKKTLRPLTIDELKAKIAYYQSGGSRGNKTADPFKNIGGRTSAASMYGRSELNELENIIMEYRAAIKEAKKNPNWRTYISQPQYNLYKQQQLVDEAINVRAKIMTQARELKKLVADPAKFYSAFISYDPVSSIRNMELSKRLRSVSGPPVGSYLPDEMQSPEASPAPGIDPATFQ